MQNATDDNDLFEFDQPQIICQMSFEQDIIPEPRFEEPEIAQSVAEINVSDTSTAENNALSVVEIDASHPDASTVEINVSDASTTETSHSIDNDLTRITRLRGPKKSLKELSRRISLCPNVIGGCKYHRCEFLHFNPFNVVCFSCSQIFQTTEMLRKHMRVLHRMTWPEMRKHHKETVTYVTKKKTYKKSLRARHPRPS